MGSVDELHDHALTHIHTCLTKQKRTATKTRGHTNTHSDTPPGHSDTHSLSKSGAPVAPYALLLRYRWWLWYHSGMGGAMRRGRLVALAVLLLLGISAGERESET